MTTRRNRTRAAFNAKRRLDRAALTPEQRSRLKDNQWERNFPYHLKRNYGITVAEYNRLAAIQHNRCAVCHEPETVKQGGRLRRLSVDHDHESGRVRGLLCHNCNRAIGLMRDSAERAYALAVYLTHINLKERLSLA